jgi:hypothetical protein
MSVIYASVMKGRVRCKMQHIVEVLMEQGIVLKEKCSVIGVIRAKEA